MTSFLSLTYSGLSNYPFIITNISFEKTHPNKGNAPALAIEIRIEKNA
jgi:hypothetical protein